MDIEYYEEDGSLHFKFSNFRRRRNNDVGLHQPNVIDGGWIIKGRYDTFDGKYHVGYYEDNFACSEIQDEIAFEVEPKKRIHCILRCQTPFAFERWSVHSYIS